MAIRDLLEQRARTVKAMRDLTESPEDNGDLSDEQSRQFDVLKDELAATEKRIERQSIIDAADRAANGVTLSEGGDDRFDAECRRFSLQRAIAAQLDPRGTDAGREIEIGRELAKRSGREPEGMFVPLGALVERRVATTGADAGNLVATDVLASEFIDALRPMTVVGALGGRVLTGMRGDVAIPKMDDLTPAAAWVAENSALSAGDHSFTQLTATTRHVGLLTEWSRKVILQSNPAIEQLVRADFAAKLAAAVDLGALKGSGAPQPTGITLTAGIGTQEDVGPITFDAVLDAIATVEAADVPMASLGWATNALVKRQAMGTTRVSGDAGAGFIAESTNSMLGYPMRSTSQLNGSAGSPTDGEMIFGAWNQAITLFWGDAGADILVNPYESTAYSKGNVQIRAFVDCDVIIRHAAAFVYMSGIQV